LLTWLLVFEAFRERACLEVHSPSRSTPLILLSSDQANKRR
jgi:hypothetical protein